MDFFPISSDASTRFNPPLEEALVKKLSQNRYDFVFSFNFFPVVSNACSRCSVKYAAWVYDSPYVQLYSATINNSCNYVFLFDYSQYQQFVCAGIETVRYLPLAAPVDRYDKMILKPHLYEKYGSEVSFVGSLYSDSKNQLYEKLTGVSEFTKGYLDGIIDVQKKIHGSFLLEKMLSADIVGELQKAYPLPQNPDGFESPAWVYANYFLARKVTSLERREILDMLSRQYSVTIYTKENTDFLPALMNRGYADYYMQMPYIFKSSKINLNITLRSIHSGIPLRVFDILGCGGFLLTNYQEDLLSFFVPDQDFVYYEDYEDLMEKADFYLRHDAERERIAGNGYQKVKDQHSYPARIKSMISAIMPSEG